MSTVPVVAAEAVNDHLRYSAEGLSNRDIFLAEVNDILVYCEDENWEEFYISFLERMDLGVTISSVFCLGGKSKLIKKIKEAPEAGKKRVFLFDKDFDDLLGSLERSKEVVYLGRYSVENYFYSIDLMVRFVVSQKKGTRRDVVHACFDPANVNDFMAWYSNVCRHFIVAQKFRLGIETTKIDLKDIAVLPAGARNDVWWERYFGKFVERIHEVAPHLTDDDALQRELDNAYVPVARCRHVADNSSDCHYPGKHLLEFSIAKIGSLLGRYEVDDVRYKLMMSSIPYLPDEVVDDISGRLKVAIDA